MPAASTSINRYSSYTPSSLHYPSYSGTGSSYGGGSSYVNRTTSLDRTSYATKASPSTKSTPSSSYLNGNYSSRYTSALPPRYSSDNYRSTRTHRTSPTKHSRISDSTGGLSDITRESRYTVGRYRESSISRDSGYSSRYSSNERSSDSDYLKRRHSVERRRESLNFEDKPRVSDRIRSYESSRADTVEERLAQRRRRLGLSPVKDILSNRHSRYSEQNGNDSSYRFNTSDSKYTSGTNNNNSTSKYHDTNGYTSSRPSVRETKFASSVRKRADSSNSEDNKSYSSEASSSFRPHSPIVKPTSYSSSTESILASIRDTKLSSTKPPSPPPPPPAKTYSSSSRVRRDEKKKISTTVQERVAARINGDGDEGPLRKRNPTSSSTGSFTDNTGLVGLRNIGNTCFMNSILQCLSNTPCLMEFILREGYSSEINTTLSTMKGDLVKSFASLLMDLWREGEGSSAVNTGTFKSQIQKFAPVFNGYAQHDAQEFLRKLLEGLHEDVNRVTARPKPITEDIDDSLGDNQIAIESWKRYLRYDDSKIVDMFVGQLKSSLQCSVCSHRSVTFDPFWDLSLPIPSRTGQVELSQCLDLFTKEEVMDNDERPTCARCKERRKMTKTFSIHKFPKVLVIHLKRFSPTERWRGKLGCNVEFPLDGLDLMRYASTSSAPCRYNLIGVANHSGTVFSGHYTAYCKHPHLGTWHEYNDATVSSISPSRVCSPEAYVLFYELSNS